MAFRLAKLIGLPSCVFILIVASLVGTRASSCLSSAAAVKDAYPWARPHWRIWPRNGGGAKCWHPGIHVAMHRHRSRIVHHRNLIAVPKPVVASIDSASNRDLSAALRETTGNRIEPSGSGRSGQSRDGGRAKFICGSIRRRFRSDSVRTPVRHAAHRRHVSKDAMSGSNLPVFC